MKTIRILVLWAALGALPVPAFAMLEYRYDEIQGKCVRTVGGYEVSSGGYNAFPYDAIDKTTNFDCMKIKVPLTDDRYDLDHKSFKGVDFSGAALNRSNLSGSDFTGAKFNDLFAIGADFSQATFRNADFSGAKVSGEASRPTSFRNSALDNASFRGLKDKSMANVDLSGASASNTAFNGLTLTDIKAERTKFNGAEFYKTTIERGSFTRAQLQNTNWEGAKIQEGADFTSANFSGKRTTMSFDTQFHKTKLTGAQFMDTRINGAWFDGVSASGASFRRASFGDAIINNGSDLSGADFCGADLGDTIIDPSVNLRGVKFDSDTILPDGWTVQMALKRGMIFHAEDQSGLGQPVMDPKLITELLRGEVDTIEEAKAKVYSSRDHQRTDSAYGGRTGQGGSSGSSGSAD